MDTTKLFDEVRQAMANNGEPYSRYMKTTFGKLNVKVLDQITGTPADVILEGDATKGDETAILTFWLPVEQAYFERANKYHLAQGMIVPYIKKEEVVTSPNAVTDEEIQTALSGRFFQIKSMLDKFTSPVPAERMLAMANAMNKPVGTVNAIKTRLSQLQAEEYEKG